MARRKRAEDEGDATSSQKQTKISMPTRRSSRKTASTELDSKGEVTGTRKSAPRKQKQPLKPEPEDFEPLESDSSSLSNPPSTVQPPSPPDIAPESPVNGTKSRRAAPKKPAPSKKASLKEHEDALMMLSREDTKDDSSTDESSQTDPNGDTTLEMSADEQDWEDVDLSRKHSISFDDLAPTEIPQNLEITLERTQQSMRIKYSAPECTNSEIKHPALLNERLECILISSMYNVLSSTGQFEIVGFKTNNFR
jgi:hypothetical protein